LPKKSFFVDQLSAQLTLFCRKKLKRFSAYTPATLKNTPKTVVPCNADGVQTVISQCPGFTSIHVKPPPVLKFW